MLLSLTAGGVGLNLIGANRMFILDIHWNPALEQQASDRIFRVGQRKNVFIYRLICEETIEERILNIQQSKISLANRICGDLSEAGSGSSKLSINDLKSLFDDDFRSNPQVL
jgi:SNF2 family DNA or RNA helicase